MSERGLDPETIREIETAIQERGELSKDEIVETWGLDNEAYAALKATLSTRRRVEPGPQRIGGFVAKRARGGIAAEEPPDGTLREDWEETAVARLIELFSHRDLEELLGPLIHTVRQSRIAGGEADRRGTKSELATALVIQHGIDLLANGEVRRALAKAGGVEAPSKWHPGKGAALEFVEIVGLPRVLAGLPREETPPSFEYLEGRFSLKPLEDFQVEVSEQLKLGIKSAGHRSIVALPTGAGKTRVAVQAIRDWMYGLYKPESTITHGATVLWLAHTEELCEQAYACFKQVWEGSEAVAPVLLVRFWGQYTHDLRHHRQTLRRILECPSVLVSTPNRIVSLLGSDDENAESVIEDLRAGLGLLVIDEAHRAAAPSYRMILAEILRPERQLPVVGLTATPFRREYLEDDPDAGTRELREIFRTLIEPTLTLGSNARATLQERGVLARPAFEVIQTSTVMQIPEVENANQPSEDELDRIDRALAVRADNSPRRLAILQHILPLARDPRNLILYFGPSVRDAECMAFLLREKGIPAAVVSGTTRDATRRLLIERFRRAELRVLCNCEVLTTGFDAPRVTHVVMARPTVSQVLYEQMVGRGLRGVKFGGTSVCTIVDCQDQVRGSAKPELGYKRFRKVWVRETSSGSEPGPANPLAAGSDPKPEISRRMDL